MSLLIGLSSGNIQENKTSSRDIKRSILGAGLGLCAFKPIAKGTHKLFLVPYKKLYNSKSMEKYKTEYNNVVDIVLKSSKLESTGLKIFDINENNLEEVSKAYFDNLPKGFKQRIKNNPRLQKSFNKNLQNVAKGNYAFYMNIANSICLNKDKRYLSVFHEMGHAYNNNISSLGKLLDKLRKQNRKVVKQITQIMTLGIILIDKRKKDDKPKNNLDKEFQKIRNNAGLIAFVAGMPVIAEEGLASINAARLTKPYISKGAYKMLNKYNFRAWLTYLGGYTANAVALASMRGIKDFIVDRKNKQ